MSSQPDIVGKEVIEDSGVGNGRTWEWPAVPGGLCRRVPSWCSTSIVCATCGSPWGGLVLDSATGTFKHRQPWVCTLDLTR